MAYKSKYTGEGIEEILDNALLKKSQQLTDTERETVKKNLGIKEPDLSQYALKDEIPKNTSEINNDTGYTTTDEVELAIKKAVSAIPIPDVGGQIAQALVDYVKKVDGKGLSTNDFTNELKKKLEDITPYDPSEIEAEISKLETALDALVGGNASNAIESFNEIIAFLANVSDKETLGGIVAGINNRIAEIEGKIPTKTSELNNDSGFLTEHQDISHLATKDELNGKVDKVDGKQLSTEDFTTLLKQKLDGLQNYDDTEVQQAVSKLRTDLDTLVSGDTTTAIKTFNEVIAFLEGVSDTEDLKGIIASIEQQIAGKQDKIDDLETIRSGASKGATALQEHQDISGKVDGDGVVQRIEKVSELPTNPDSNTLYIIV